MSYIDKKTLKEGDLIMFVIDEFGLRELEVIARVIKIDDNDIFIDEIWSNKKWALDKYTGLQEYYYVTANFGKEEWNGIENLKNRLPEYFI